MRQHIELKEPDLQTTNPIAAADTSDHLIDLGFSNNTAVEPDNVTS